MLAGVARAQRLVADRYELECELARGGMGVVYRAVDRTTGQAIALKRSLGANGAGAELQRTMLQREYQTLVTLRHPHIIEVYDFGSDEDGPYYTMELLDGTDLRAKSPLPWREVCAYLRDIASSLALLHSRRLLHSDVSVANIRLTGRGGAKLLDFGSLASFGRSTVIAGAPPTMAPEVLDGSELDARVDLYALGATAYCALSGRHAYPAAMLGLLRAVWAQGRPRPPSAHVGDIPPELDSLVLSLLSLDRDARPASAAEVMERLSAIAGLPSESEPLVARSYLLSAGLVGRGPERRALEVGLDQALAGRGSAVVISGAPGLGKSALLDELSQKARVKGARVLRVNARAHPGTLGSWTALAREASPAGSLRRLEAASEAVFFRQAETAPLVLAIEDLHEADRDSVAALTALGTDLRDQRVLLVATFDPSHARAKGPAQRRFLERSLCVELRPFDKAATRALVEGLFGDVAASQRLATFLDDHAAGNPRACAEIVAHLVEKGVLRYAEGTWTLPHELPEFQAGAGGLVALAAEVFESRIAQWSEPLRCLALCLSPQRRAFHRELIDALVADRPQLQGKNLKVLLDELVREGVLVEGDGAYAFARPSVQKLFYARLTDAQRVEQHGRLAALLVRTAGDDPLRGFEVAFHFLLANDERRARQYFDRNVWASFLDSDLLIEAVPDLWALLDELRRRGASDQEVQFVEGALVISGFYLDPTVYDRLAERCLSNLHRTMGFALANRLSPWVSRPVALFIGLFWALLKNLFRRSGIVNGGPFRATLLGFVGLCASLSAGACFRGDERMLRRLQGLLDVARGFGRFNSLRLIYDLFEVNIARVQGRLAAAERGVRDQLTRLPRIPFLTVEGRHQFEAGLEFGMGRFSLQKLGPGALPSAERIDALGGRYDRLLAQLLRRSHYVHRGEVEAAKREEERFDEMAALYGSRWVPDLVAVLEFIPYHLSGDVLGLKRTLHRVDEFLVHSPGLKTTRNVIAAMYEGHRGRPDRALELYGAMNAELSPFTTGFWAAARAHQAECLNALGRPAEALAICAAARACLTAEDRAFVFAYQQLERESAHALAKLGRFEEAVQLAEALLAECADSDNPLLVGLLHVDRARIACLAHDRSAFEAHAERARALFVPTANHALIARLKRVLDLARNTGLSSAANEGAGQAAGAIADDFVQGAASTELLRNVVASLGARSAYLYRVIQSEVLLCARLGEAPPAALSAEIGSIVQKLGHTESRVLPAVGWTAESTRDRCVLPLVAPDEAQSAQLVGVLVVSDCEDPAPLSRLDLQRIASQLILDEDARTELV